MSDFKHTPGPWHVSTNGCTEESGGEPAFPGVHDSSGRPHGGDFICQTLGDSETCKANARLISASPELFEALSAYILNERHLNDEHFAGVQERLRAMAQAALAKAKGETCK